MSDRIKVAEDNFDVINYYLNEDEIIKCSEQLKQQILEDQEKAEKWDKHTQIYTKDSFLEKEKLEQENKQLKDLYEVVEKRNKSMNDELINLKQKLEMMKKLSRK